MDHEFGTSYAPYSHVTRGPWLSWSIGAGVLAVLAVQVTLLHQQAAMSNTITTLQVALAQQNGNGITQQIGEDVKDRGSATPFVGSAPARFLLDGLTPSSDQALRGDCWLFATSGILEDSYRRYGIAKGWFEPGKYLRLSRQHLGIAFMEECKKSPTSFCPSKNLMPENHLSWGNTTEGEDGSDERQMYYMRASQLGAYGAMADTACPYYTGDTTNPTKPNWMEEHYCGQDLESKRKRNPLSFKVKAMREHFARDDIKRQLREGGHALTLGLGEIATPMYTPCEKRAGCDQVTAQCVPCPVERAFVGVSCCVLKKKPMVTMKGEWFHVQGEPLMSEGGHAINIVGYNDHYRTEWGATGGYIIRNTWKDGLGFSHNMKARGSHSAAFFMQVCPNPSSPRSWMPCDDAETCAKTISRMEALTTRKVHELECTDLGPEDGALPKGACAPGGGHYLINMTEFGTAGLFTACFLHMPSSVSEASTTCHPPLTIDDLALVYQPTAAELATLGENDPDLCGYNFLPYATYEALMARFGGVVASSFEIEWTERSYVARADPAYDYASIKASTHTLKSVPHYEPMHFSPTKTQF